LNPISSRWATTMRAQSSLMAGLASCDAPNWPSGSPARGGESCLAGTRRRRG
jgi:hypothetical protein